MSRFSGKCDLADHIEGQGGWLDKEGNPVDKNYTGVHYSDEYNDFLEFKKRTGGVLHQIKKVKVTKENQANILEHCIDKFEIKEYIENIPDKRYKNGVRTQVNYIYKYWDKEYTSLKEINKEGVWVAIDIHFDTLLDLIPYYPYIISMSVYNNGKEIIYLSNESHVIEKRNDSIALGNFNSYWEHYAKELQEHYKEVVLKYYKE